MKKTIDNDNLKWYYVVVMKKLYPSDSSPSLQEGIDDFSQLMNTLGSVTKNTAISSTPAPGNKDWTEGAERVENAALATAQLGEAARAIGRRVVAELRPVLKDIREATDMPWWLGAKPVPVSESTPLALVPILESEVYDWQETGSDVSAVYDWQARGDYPPRRHLRLLPTLVSTEPALEPSVNEALVTPQSPLHALPSSLIRNAISQSVKRGDLPDLGYEIY